jgi:hypothetical protein
MYSLPQTVVSATVTLVSTNKKPGHFTRFTPCFFHDVNVYTDVIYEDAADLKIDSAALSSRGIPDLTKVYVIDLTSPKRLSVPT